VALFVISGVPASGKTTVAQLLASRRDRAVCVAGDAIRAMVVTGRADMRPGAGEAELGQLLLRYRGALAVASVYLDAGFDVVFEDVIIGPVLREFLTLVPVPEIHLVFLDPDATALAERDRGRAKTAYGECWDVRELSDVLRLETARLGLWLDSTELSAGQTVDRILGDREASLVLVSRPLAPPSPQFTARRERKSPPPFWKTRQIQNESGLRVSRKPPPIGGPGVVPRGVQLTRAPDTMAVFAIGRASQCSWMMTPRMLRPAIMSS
jgi:predicted kinase